MRDNLPLAHGANNGIILTQVRRGTQSEYHVYRQGEGRSMFFEGSEFYPSASKHRTPPMTSIDKHLFVFRYHIDKDGVESEKAVGIAHNKKELMRRTKQCAVNYCKNKCRKIGGSFSDRRIN